MVNKFIDKYFLSHYLDSDFIVQQKVRILTKTLAAVIVLILLFFIYWFRLKFTLGELLLRTAMLVCCFGLLYLIKKGKFEVAGYLALTAVLSTLWGVMFLDANELLAKSDTLVLVICAFSSGALLLNLKKYVIPLFLLLNSIALLVFCLHIKEIFDLPSILVIEYFADGFIALSFVSFIAIQSMKINNEALDKANQSITLANAEVDKNKVLSQTLEYKVQTRTEELSKNNEELSREIAERKRAETRLKAAQKKLVDNAHKAGMAEMATDTLHNVGNILNSVKTSAHMINSVIGRPTVEGYSKACELLRKNRDNLSDFLFRDEVGQKTINYFLSLEKEFQSIFNMVEVNAKRLNRKVDAIAEVIVAQQNYAGTASFTESLNIIDIMEDSLNIVADLLTEQNIVVEKHFNDLPQIKVQKTKLLHTFVNLLKNAVQAMSESTREKRLLKIKTTRKGEQVIIEIEDNGIGIEKENLKKIFSHGFTTRKDGHGFGLHSCANYLNEMGATIKAQSKGINRGASFLLTFSI